MVLPTSLMDREKGKFVEISSEVTVRLVGITGVFTASDKPRSQLEHDKLVENAAGDIAVRVVVS
jgi:hypothetical protein